jgi:hypothetical protein
LPRPLAGTARIGKPIERLLFFIFIFERLVLDSGTIWWYKSGCCLV